jgi:hypothetical protein
MEFAEGGWLVRPHRPSNAVVRGLDGHFSEHDAVDCDPQFPGPVLHHVATAAARVHIRCAPAACGRAPLA